MLMPAEHISETTNTVILLFFTSFYSIHDSNMFYRHIKNKNSLYAKSFTFFKYPIPNSISVRYVNV